MEITLSPRFPPPDKPEETTVKIRALSQTLTVMVRTVHNQSEDKSLTFTLPWRR